MKEDLFLSKAAALISCLPSINPSFKAASWGACGQQHQIPHTPGIIPAQKLPGSSRQSDPYCSIS